MLYFVQLYKSDLSSPQTEYYARKLLQKMKHTLPNFHVSLALSTVKISKLFSKSAKAPPGSIIETANTNYNFVCVCKSNYIGRCHRPLDHRIKEHYRFGKDGNEIFVTSYDVFLLFREITRYFCLYFPHIIDREGAC